MGFPTAATRVIRGFCLAVAFFWSGDGVAFGAETGVEAVDPAVEEEAVVTPEAADGEERGVPPAVFVLPKDGRGLSETERLPTRPPVSGGDRLRQRLRGIEAQLDGVDRRQRVCDLRIRQRERVSNQFQARRKDGRSLRLDLERRNLDFRRNVLRQELRTLETRSLLDRQRARPSTSRPPYRGLR